MFIYASWPRFMLLENWDDDFEFNPNSPPRKKKVSTTKSTNSDDVGPPRMSTTSSRYTMDWDADVADNPRNSPSRNRTKVFIAPKLANRADPGPSTPARRPAPTMTENWDDDFEDKNDTPVRRVRGDQSSPTKEIIKNYRSLQPLMVNENAEHRLLTPGRNRASSSASTQYVRSKYIPPGDLFHGNTFPQSDCDEEEEFGFMDKDEDRTVTGRLRRPRFARLNSLTNHPLSLTPPPPVPSIPASLLTQHIPPTAQNRELNTSPTPQPFPRSPSSSVFSLPTTIAGESAYYGSTAHLHPTASRTSSSGGGFAHLPPSPPIHKERERRRLRKKSRPQPQGVFELIAVEPNHSSGLASLQEVERPASPARSSNNDGSHSRPRTPQTPASSTKSSPAPSPHLNINSTPSSARHSIQNVPPTPSGTKGALLSRIGSVKKWGVRRKRGFSVSQKDNNAPQVNALDVAMGPPEDPRILPRPNSSLSSLPLSTSSRQTSSSRPVSPPTSHPNWFFRNSGTFTSPVTASSLESSYGARASATDLSLRGRSYDRNGPTRDSRSKERDKSKSKSRSRNQSRSRNRTPSRSRDAQGVSVASGSGKAEVETPSKLLKRKSLGFVQLRKTLPGQGNANASDGSDVAKTESSGQMRHASFGGAVQETENLNPSTNERGRRMSLSVTKAKIRQQSRVVEEAEKTQEGPKKFIRNVRRISLVGRHKREKSGSTFAQFVGVKIERARTSIGSQHEQTVPAAIIEDVKVPNTPVTPGGLLPPLELEAPLHIAIEPPASADLQPVTPAETVSSDPPANQCPPSPPAPLPASPPTSPKQTTPKKRPLTPGKSPSSPQSASLGRSAYSPGRDNESPSEKTTVRRNSLGDLKIPARISQAQVGLRRDLGMVREFATSVEQLRELQATYHELVVEIQRVLDAHAHLHAQQQATRSVSPSFFSRPMRRRSNTNPSSTTPPAAQLAYKQLASTFYTINSKYRITWECAELLIELGGGSSAGGQSAPSTSVSAPAMQEHNEGSLSIAQRKGRERAITLAGDESKPASPIPGVKSILEQSGVNTSSVAWRASTGRQELSQRQMILLKELLNNADSSFINEEYKPVVPEEAPPSMRMNVNTEWKWGDPANSTVTLPPSESSASGGSSAAQKKRRTSRLGMAGLRDLLRMLKRHHTAHPTHPMPHFGSIPQSTASLTSTTNSSSDVHYGYNYPSSGDLSHLDAGKAATYGRRRAKTSSGPESVRDVGQLTMPSSTFSLYDSNPLPPRQSKGRPSLAAIFRIPKPLKPNKVSGSHSDQQDDGESGISRGNETPASSNGNGDEDWDRIDSATDLDGAVKTVGATMSGDGMSTIRVKGRSPYLQQPAPTSFKPGRGRATSPNPNTPKRIASSSQTSLYEDSPTSSSHNVRPTRLSNVDEDTAEHPRSAVQRSSSKTKPPPSPSSSANVNISPLTPPPRTSSKLYHGNKTSKNGSVRSMPPQRMAELRLAMTPENIKPLVENAKEVHVRLVECIAEIRSLLENHWSSAAPTDPST
ncbi:hypothetical protein AX17_006860 [Amanita inopinata Kibby_2008]|nr:hypothetical protein AX17_006860 [Amanita inopinata Kibby_2008]